MDTLKQIWNGIVERKVPLLLMTPLLLFFIGISLVEPLIGAIILGTIIAFICLISFVEGLSRL